MRWVRLGPVGLRALYGWLAVISGLVTIGLAVAGQVTNALITFNLLLSFLALWQTARVEVVADPAIVDPKA